MVKKSFVLLLVFCSLFISRLHAQDTLPNFRVRNVGNNRFIISWVNNYELVKQISIQRSFDSLKNYKTILTVPDPNNKENGYVDTKAPNDHMFYRLFIMLNGAMYTFSPAKKPVIDTMHATTKAAADSLAALRKLDPFSLEVNKPGVRNIDSMLNTNKLTDRNKPSIFIPSMYVYTSRDGNVHLNLPDVESKKYWVKFFDSNNQFLFEIRNLKERSLIVDKANFYHAGWFNFELYVDDKLKEKHRFYLEKEF
jgi:hypothetical protein